jgi:hypothetical protein
LLKLALATCSSWHLQLALAGLCNLLQLAFNQLHTVLGFSRKEALESSDCSLLDESQHACDQMVGCFQWCVTVAWGVTGLMVN